MIPAGYMAKRVLKKPDWIEAQGVEDIYSISSHVSADFADYINYWKHNGYWLFDSPAVIESLARQYGIDMQGTKMFYYEIYDQEWDEKSCKWQAFLPEPSFDTDVKKPSSMALEGFDAVTFWAHTSPECSPLSCNGLAKDIKTNKHCLFESFDAAKTAVETNTMTAENRGEPGPYRIFAVYSLGD
jgi:hypothetical protein